LRKITPQPGISYTGLYSICYLKTRVSSKYHHRLLREISPHASVVEIDKTFAPESRKVPG